MVFLIAMFYHSKVANGVAEPHLWYRFELASGRLKGQ